MRIVITGIGIVSALGVGKKATLDALLHERSGITPLPAEEGRIGSLPVGEVNLNSEAGIPRSVTLALPAAREALDEAGIRPSDTMALINGTTVGGMDITEAHVADWEQGAETDTIAMHDTGAVTSLIAQQLGSFHTTMTPSTACSSAMNAIIIGCNMLRCGRVESVLAGGTECLTHFHLNGFNALRILSDEPCRPFDMTRRGLNLGEGAAYLVLESEEHAKARGAHILAYIAGYGNACDAFHQTASSDIGEGAYLAMHEALTMAQVRPEQVDYINAHGTGTPNNDASEWAAIQRLFTSHIPYFSSTKALTGHTTSACGSIEAVISVLCMQVGMAPGQANLVEPMADATALLQHNTSMTLRYVLCNAFGFGGNDSSLLLSRDAGNELSTAACAEELQVVSSVTLTEQADYKSYLPLMMARRLTPGMRQVAVAAKQALAQAGLTTPDAIITATRWGCIVNTVKFMDEMMINGEQELAPTAFIQSTHNTLSALMAILTGAHGYNNTYSQSTNAFEAAMSDAQMLLTLTNSEHVLLLDFDESDDHWNEWLRRAGIYSEPHARAMVVRRLHNNQ